MKEWCVGHAIRMELPFSWWCQDDLTHHHLMIIINHEKIDSSPMLGAFQWIWGIDSHQDLISLHVCQCGQDNVKLHYKAMDQYWFSPSFRCEIGLKDENTPKHRIEVGSEHTLMLRACPWFVRHPHQGLVETPHVATRVALVVNHHFCRPVPCATYLAMEGWTSEVAFGVHLRVQDGKGTMGDVLYLLLPSGRITPLHNHYSTWFDFHNP